MGDFTSLALDLGSTFGWAVGNNGIIQATGEVSLSAKDSHPGHRWIKWQEWLYQHRNVNEILFEDVSGFKGFEAAKIYGAQLGVLQIFSLVHGIRMCSLSPQQVKKDFTSKGNANKFQMCDVALNLGWKNGARGTDKQHNECDAIALIWVIYTRRLIQPSFGA